MRWIWKCNNTPTSSEVSFKYIDPAYFYAEIRCELMPEDKEIIVHPLLGWYFVLLLDKYKPDFMNYPSFRWPEHNSTKIFGITLREDRTDSLAIENFAIANNDDVRVYTFATPFDEELLNVVYRASGG